MLISKDDATIRTPADWLVHAPPKRDTQWRPGRSAYEIAAAWCGDTDHPSPPAEVLALFGSHPDFDSVELVSAVPEHRIRFDRLRGEPRNADLAVVARDARGTIAITIEGKSARAAAEQCRIRAANAVLLPSDANSAEPTESPTNSPLNRTRYDNVAAEHRPG